MLTDTELAKLIVSWKSQTGTEIRGRMCVPVDSALRINMYKDLIETLIVNHGYAEDDLMSTMTKRMVIEASLNPNSPGKKTWETMATADWEQSVADRFPVQVLTHNPDSVDTSRRKENVLPPVKQAPVEEVKEDTSNEPFALSKEEFDYLAERIGSDFDRSFIADMTVTLLRDLTKKQSDRLTKIRSRIEILNSAPEKKKKKSGPEPISSEAEDPRLLRDNPVDMSIFAGMPPVQDQVDEEFLKLIDGTSDE